MKVDKPCLHKRIVQASGLQNNVYFLPGKLDEKGTKLHVLAPREAQCPYSSSWIWCSLFRNKQFP